MSDRYYIGYRLYANCPNCNSEAKITKLNLCIPLECSCKEKTEIFHISEIYNQIKIIESSIFIEKKEKYNKNNLNSFIKSTLPTIRKIISNYFSSYSNLFIIYKNEFSDEEYDENASEFFEENDIEKMKKNISNLKNYKISEKIVQNLKIFLLDILHFVLLIKKCPCLDKLIFPDIYYDKGEFGEVSFKLYLSIQEELKIHFLPGYDYQKNIIYKVIPILEKNVFLLAFIDKIKILDIHLKSYIFSIKAKISEAKIYKISSEDFIVFKEINNSIPYENQLQFMKIKYNSENKPVELYETYLLEKDIKSNIKYKIKDAEVIDDKNIICTDLDNRIYFLKKNENKKFYIYKEIKEMNIPRKSCVYFLSDKINEQVIIYSDNINDLLFYDLDINLKKNMKNFHDIETVQILNENVYLLKTSESIIIISSKYLEIIFQYKIDIECNKILMLRHSGNFLILTERSDHSFYFRFINNELKFLGQKCYDENKYIDVKEINENGDHIVFTNQNLVLNKKKYNFPILYFYKKDKNFMDGLPNFKEIKVDNYGLKFWNLQKKKNNKF